MERLIANTTTSRSNPTGICLIAASNGNHMNAALFGSDPNNRVNILTRRPEIFKGKTVSADYLDGREPLVGKVNVVTSCPRTAADGCSIFILSCPVNAQESLLRQIKPFVPENSFVGSIFG